MAFYNDFRQLQQQVPPKTLTVHDWNGSSRLKAGRLYQHKGGLFIVTEQNVALVFPDDQIEALVREGLINPKQLKPETVN